MSYDNPHRETYYFPSSAFGAATETKTFKGPSGKKGLVRDIRHIFTADAVGTTTVPEIDVGSASGDYSFARFRLGSTATAGYTAAGGPYRARAIARAAPGNPGGKPPQANDYAGHIFLEGNSGGGSTVGTVDVPTYIPADTNFVITRKAGTGGTPAGTGETYVDVDWF